MPLTLPSRIGLRGRTAPAGWRWPTAVAFTTWAYALARTPVGALGATIYAVPALTVLMSWGILGEVPRGAALAGGTLCLTGVAISRRRQPKPARFRQARDERLNEQGPAPGPRTWQTSQALEGRSRPTRN